MTIEKTDIEKIKHTYAIEDVVRGCGVTLSERAMGERLQAHCPFPHHEDSTPSFVIYPRSGTFRCFGCGIGGDVFDFLQHYHGWSFLQAWQSLTGTQGITPFPSTAPHSRMPVAPAPLRAHRQQDQHTQLPDHRQILTLATTCYQQELLRHPHVLSYVDERAISLEAVRHLCLGYSDGQRLPAQIKRDPSLWAEANTVGLLTGQGHDRLACRLVIPEMREEQAVYLIGRMIPPGRSRQKYLGLATKKRLLGYGEAMCQIMHQEQQVKGLLIVEGALDFVLAWQWQLPVCCVALLSTWASQLQLDEIAELYAHITGTPVLVFLDADPSGVRSTPTLLSQLRHRGLPAVPLPPIEGVKDIGELGQFPDGQACLLQTVSDHLRTRC
jgi:DNA primase